VCEGKPPVNFGPGQNVQWKTAVGSGLSSPIIWTERIFLTEFDRPSQNLATLCIDRRTGNILWRRSVAVEQIEEVHELSSPAGPTPATDGERVYVYFGSYGLLCYDLDGNPIWERKLPLPQNPYGATASPIVAGELLVLNHQGKEAYLLGVNRRDGRTVWRTDRSLFRYGWSTPVHWRQDGTDEIVVLGGDFEPNPLSPSPEEDPRKHPVQSYGLYAELCNAVFEFERPASTATTYETGRRK
jgi:outer membrane protein assembly factor BamB